MKLGFAITCYNKFEEANIGIEILKKEFKKSVQIVLTSNYPNSEKEIEYIDFDKYVQQEEIPFLGGDIHNPENIKKRVSIVLRSTNGVITSCKEALKLDVDYIIHNHSDAWCFDEEKIYEIVNEMKRLNKKIAIRGIGLEEYRADAPLGHVDDHFFIFEKKYALENNIFEIDLGNYFPHKLTVHGILFLNFLLKYGLKNIWYYRNTKELETYDGKILKIGGVRPVSFDPYYKFFHLHRESFPEQYGKNIQALYLKKYTNGKSKVIEKFIKEYYCDEKILLKNLSKIEKKLDKKLKIRFFEKNILESREINFKESLLKEFTIKIFIKNILKKIEQKIKRNKAPLRIDKYYKNEIKIQDFIKIDWLDTLYYNKDKR